MLSLDDARSVALLGEKYSRVAVFLGIGPRLGGMACVGLDTHCRVNLGSA
jgi:hypothetical protein